MNNIIFKTILLKGESGAITSIEKTNTNVLVDTYTVTYNDGTTATFEVTNGRSIVSFELVSSTGGTNVYKVTYNDNTSENITLNFPVDYVTPQLYGAQGDGVHDDLPALQYAIDNSPTGVVFLPKGTYKIVGQLNIKSGTHLIGCGSDTVIISSADTDAVYHTVCSYNARNINARLCRNVEDTTNPALADYITEYDENIIIENLVIDGNWQNRDLTTWEQVYEQDGNTTNREYGTALELQAVRNCVVRNVIVKNGIQHNINVRGGAYCYNMGYDYVAEMPSYNVIIENCKTYNQRYDDCITTHDSHDITIRDCYVSVENNANGTYNGAISNGIEIDDGSRFILVENCVSEFNFVGFQAKGHNNTPSAHNVTFKNCVARHTNVGIILESAGGGEYTLDEYSLVGRCHDIIVRDFTVDGIYNFNNISSYVNTDYFAFISGVLNCTIDGVVLKNVDNVSGYSNIGSTTNIIRSFRLREKTINVTIKNVRCNEPLAGYNYAFIHCEGGVKGTRISNICMNGYTNTPLIKINRNTYTDILFIENVTNVRKTSSDVLVNINGITDAKDYGNIILQGDIRNVIFINENRSNLWSRNSYGMIFESHTSESAFTTDLKENVAYVVNQDCVITVDTVALKTKCAIVCSSTATKPIVVTLVYNNQSYEIRLKPTHGAYLQYINTNTFYICGDETETALITEVHTGESSFSADLVDGYAYFINQDCTINVTSTTYLKTKCAIVCSSTAQNAVNVTLNYNNNAYTFEVLPFHGVYIQKFDTNTIAIM